MFILKINFQRPFSPLIIIHCAFKAFWDVGFNYELVFLGLKYALAIALTSKSMVDIIIKGKNHWYRAL